MVPQVGSNPPAQPSTTRTLTITGEHFSGPIPPPGLLAKYNETIPDGADRILRMAERQQVHRHDLERKVIEGEIRRAQTGVYCGLMIGLAGVSAGAYLCSIGQVVAGLALAGTSLTSLVGTFVYGTKERRKEREQRDEANRKLLQGR